MCKTANLKVNLVVSVPAEKENNYFYSIISCKTRDPRGPDTAVLVPINFESAL